MRWPRWRGGNEAEVIVRRLSWIAVACLALTAPTSGRAQEEGPPVQLMRDENGEVVTRAGLWLDENGDWFGHPGELARAGLLREATGKWVAPTPEAALRALRIPRDEFPPGASPSYAARAVLTQRFETRSRAELDAFAETLVQIALTEPAERTGDVGWQAKSALRSSKPDHGVPYEGAFDAMRRLYEASLADVPPRGDGLFSAHAHFDPLRALHSLYDMEPEGRGRDILHDVIADMEPPPPDTIDGFRRRWPWCAAVRYIFRHHWFSLDATYEGGILGGVPKTREESITWALRRTDEALRGLPGDAALFDKVCGAGVIRVS